ncbi:MAG: hypothetical protein ACOYYF_07980 [Chloroflexota bacterium]|nr:hypothetical protein [Chloroflexota bacterium]MBI5704846.1 hypothetical protein [Chloroflexota bacterium]
MPKPESFRELIHPAAVSDMLALFQSLLESREISPPEALALAGAIHAGLRKPHRLNGAAYAQYARAMALLEHHLPDVYRHIVANWRPPTIRPSASKRTYTDSLFDDTAVVPVPRGKNVS